MQLKAFDLAEVTGWFKPSSERIYAATGPIAEFEVPLSLEAGMHKIEMPEELRNVDELIVSTVTQRRATTIRHSRFMELGRKGGSMFLRRWSPCQILI